MTIYPSETLIVSEEEADQRIDKLLAMRYGERSRSYFQYLIAEGLVTINGATVKKRTRVLPDQEIALSFLLTPESSLEAENIPLDLVYEDDALLGINKPAGMLVHPTPGHWSGTVANALLFHCKGLEGADAMRPGIVHRLDKETSGVLLAAKNAATQKLLSQQFADRKVRKRYLAICVGNPGEGMVDLPLARHPVHRTTQTIDHTGGKEALTYYRTLAYDHRLSLVEAFPKTGRTHQIRVHLASVGAPVLGDKLYGSSQANKSWKVDRHLLHAADLQLTQPHSGELLHMRAPIPADFLATLAQFAGEDTSLQKALHSFTFSESN